LSFTSLRVATPHIEKM